MGFFSDLLVLPFIITIEKLYSIFWFNKEEAKIGKFIRLFFFYVFISFLIFKSVSEILFWKEFNCRFNFIAVDYLIYTNEVFKNVVESYNMIMISISIAVISFFVFMLSIKIDNSFAVAPKKNVFINNIFKLIFNIFICYLVTFIPLHKVDTLFKRQVDVEISKNGLYCFVYAFVHNSIPYDDFYITKNDLNEKYNIHTNNEITIPKKKENDRSTKKHNVVIVLMESMSASFMKNFGNNENLTPNLDKLATEGILFTKLYATGTRTVRGIEAIMLSTPPIPGQSIVRRPGNENLNSLSSVFKRAKYDTKFIYGGRGFFDNMNYFFSNNSCDVIDIYNFEDSEITFKNAWGLCDEDLFKKVEKEADLSYTKNNPFFFFVLTTSNHRPFTFPENKIDLPSKESGRNGGVKYADFAIGQFIESVKNKPWFNDTIFLFVADHTAGCAGNKEIDVEGHHIPAILYAPKILPSKTIDTICSQIDLPVTLSLFLELPPYPTFFGEDLFSNTANRAFISNYQKIALLDDDVLCILKPIKDFSIYKNNELVKGLGDCQNILQKTVMFYEKASSWKNKEAGTGSIKIDDFDDKILYRKKG